MIQKEYLQFDKNILGVNFGKTECIVESLEFADCNNVELRPEGGVSKRPGTYALDETSGICTGIHNYSLNDGREGIIIHCDDNKIYTYNFDTPVEIPEWTQKYNEFVSVTGEI